MYPITVTTQYQSFVSEYEIDDQRRNEIYVESFE